MICQFTGGLGLSLNFLSRTNLKCVFLFLLASIRKYSLFHLKKAGQLTCTIEVNGLVIIFKCVALLVVFLLKGLFTKYVAKLAKGKSPKWYCCITAMDFEHCKLINLFQTFLFKMHFGLNV